MKLNEWEMLSSTILSLSSVFAIFVGGGFTWMEYNRYKADVKNSNSLQLVSEYHSKDFLKKREKLNNAWKYYLKWASTDHKTKTHNEFVTELIEKKKISTEVEHLMEFYSRVVTCVDTNLCNKVVIDKFFLKNGNTFFNKYYPYACKLRKEWKDNSIWSITENYFSPNGIGKICRN